MINNTIQVASFFQAFANEIRSISENMLIECFSRYGVTNALDYEKKTGNASALFISPTVDSKYVAEFQRTENIDMLGNNASVDLLPARKVNGVDDVTPEDLQTAVINGIFELKSDYNMVLLNAQIATVIKDQSGFTPATVEEITNQSSTHVHYIGKFDGVTVYNAPNMEWDDTKAVFMKAIDSTVVKFTEIDKFEIDSFTVVCDFSDYGAII